MIIKQIKDFFNNRRKKKVLDLVEENLRKINELEPAMKVLSNEDLKDQTRLFKERLANGETLDDILVEAFATVREASCRVFEKRPYDVQVKGGLVLHKGAIAEMKTGEGKTLVFTMPTYLNALTGKGVHVLTVNSYLTQRDGSMMSLLYSFLGLSTGIITNDNTYDEKYKREQYRKDITYIVNNECGFDFLRDNMNPRVDDNEANKDSLFEKKIQRPLHCLFLDEADSAMIDEHTPLIISGEQQNSKENLESYVKACHVVRQLSPQDYTIELKNKNITLNSSGYEKIEEYAKHFELIAQNSYLFDKSNEYAVHRIKQALKAEYTLHRNIDYMSSNDTVLIIDPFTGRTLAGHEYSDGLQQAVQTKEGVTLTPETKTAASITFQNFFRHYPKLSGMTGTAITDEVEFQKYGLDVYVIPTNKPIQRIDHDDKIFCTFDEKIHNIILEVKKRQLTQQPILIGTISVEKSEAISQHLTEAGILHSVLNAKNHALEAKIISKAGEPGRVTVATNMAGRGTDIYLGMNYEFYLAQELAKMTKPDAELDPDGFEKYLEQVHQLKHDLRVEMIRKKDIVIKAGGLCVLGTERHDSRRIDFQLRGRCARQGDVGESQFFLSLEDDLVQRFLSDKVGHLIKYLNADYGEAISSPSITAMIAHNQDKIQESNSEIRKYMERYDNSFHDQRDIYYKRRQNIMTSNNWAIFMNDLIKLYVENWMQHAATQKELLDIELLTAEYTSRLDYTWRNCKNLIFSDETIEKMTNALKKLSDANNYKYVLDTMYDFLHKKLAIIDKSVTNDKEASEDEEDLEVSYTTTKNIIDHQDRKVALDILDNLWSEHLSNLGQLRDGVHLLGYGQKDPLVEYSKQSFVFFEQTILAWQHSFIDSLIDEKVISTIYRSEKNMDKKDSDSFNLFSPELMNTFSNFLGKKGSLSSDDDKETADTDTESSDNEDFDFEKWKKKYLSKIANESGTVSDGSDDDDDEEEDDDEDDDDEEDDDEDEDEKDNDTDFKESSDDDMDLDAIMKRLNELKKKLDMYQEELKTLTTDDIDEAADKLESMISSNNKKDNTYVHTVKKYTDSDEEEK